MARSLAAVASAVSWPAWIWPSMADGTLNDMVMRPAIRSPVICGLPGYGTSVSLMPARCANNAAASCGKLPAPVDPESTSPGFALASAISSATLCILVLGLTTSTRGVLERSPTAAKSLITSIE